MKTCLLDSCRVRFKPYGRGTRQRYCSLRCKRAAHRERLRARFGGWRERKAARATQPGFVPGSREAVTYAILEGLGRSAPNDPDEPLKLPDYTFPGFAQQWGEA